MKDFPTYNIIAILCIIMLLVYGLIQLAGLFLLAMAESAK
jgi:hypothetical protein